MASSSTQPWTPDEIRAKASSWSLEGDSKLLEFMQSISENLDKRASKTTSSIHRLSLEVDRTKLSLENVTNQLAALQHSQFVENRVYEDDETLANESEVPAGEQDESKTKYDPIETLTKLLNDSMAVIERNFEKVSIEIDDSDEEDDSPKSVIYRPKDPYEHEPLPHIIGSKEWMEKWHLGICDSDEDFSGEEKEEEYSDSSESASMSTSLPSNAPTLSESELSAWGLQQNAVESQMKRGTQSYESSDEDLSAATKESHDTNRFHSNNRAQPGQYRLPVASTDSLSANQYYIHQPKERAPGLFDESTDESSDSELYNVKGNAERTVPYPAMRQNNMISHIFSDEPPPDTDVVDKQTKPAADLFCESEDERTVPPPPTIASRKKEDPTVGVHKIRKKTVNLFDDDEFDSFMKELNNKTQEKAEVAEKPRRNLFEESSGEEEIKEKRSLAKSRIMENNKEQSIVSDPKVRVQVKNSEILFNEADRVPSPDLEISRPLAAPRKTLFTSLFSDEPPDDDFDSLFSGETVVNRKESQQSVVKSESLFDDADKRIQTSVNTSHTAQTVKQDLHKSNQSVDHLDIKQQSKPKLKYSNLFGDESDDDSGDLFDKIVSGPTGLAKGESMITSLISSSSSLLETHERNSNELIANEIRTKSENGIIKKDLRDAMEQSGSEQKLESKSAEKFISNTLSEETASIFDDVEPYGNTPDVRTQPLNVEGLLSEITNAEGGKNLPLFCEQHVEDSADFTVNKQPPSLVSNLNEAIPNRSDENKISEEVDEIIENEPEKAMERLDKETVKNESARRILNEQKSKQTTVNENDMQENDDPVYKNNTTSESSSKSDGHKKISVWLPNVDSALNSPPEQKEKESDVAHDEQGTHNDSAASSHKNLLSDNASSDAYNIFQPTASSSTKTSQVFSTILFSDVPPTDDEPYFDVSSKETPSLDNDLESEDFGSQNMDASSSALNYNPISLFHDIPPDDDFDAMPRDGKKLHSIFYDDFSETIIPSQIDSKPKSLSSFIFDEPPPDSVQGDPKSAATVGNRTDKKEDVEDPAQSKRLDSESKIASIIDRMQKVADDEPLKTGAAKVIPSPKKLNMNLNINVSALLPGAKRLIPKVADADRSSEEKEAEGTDDVVDKSSKTIQVESDPSMLQSLNKSRAKIQVKRRPSTRKARQDNYRQSLIESENDKVGNNTNGNTQGIPSSSAIFGENFANQNINDPSYNLDSNSKGALPSNPPVEIESKENRIEAAPKHATFKLFDDDPPIAPTTEVKDTSKKTSSLFFEPEKEDVRKGLFQTSPTIPVVAVASVKSTKHDALRNTSKPIKNNDAIKLFGDESDDDDLFKNKLSSSEGGAAEISNQVTSTIGKAPERISVKQSIFESEDEDDDLFGSGSISDIAPKIIAPTKLETKKLNPSRLFDDEGDDDDLFGGGDNRTRTISQPTSSSTAAKKIEIKKATTIATSSADKSDFKDPLADLFKN